jgi:hypothetical protein
MKRQMLTLAAIGALFGLTGVPALAQAGVRVMIPFNFVVADTAFPQGQYLISSTRDRVFIQNSQGKTIAAVLSNAVSGRSIGKTGQVVFQCYDQRCFLSEVWTPTQDAGRQLLKSRWEKEFAKKEAPKYLALVATDN